MRFRLPQESRRSEYYSFYDEGNRFVIFSWLITKLSKNRNIFAASRLLIQRTAFTFITEAVTTSDTSSKSTILPEKTTRLCKIPVYLSNTALQKYTTHHCTTFAEPIWLGPNLCTSYGPLLGYNPHLLVLFVQWACSRPAGAACKGSSQVFPRDINIFW